MPDLAKEQADLERAERDIREGEERIANQSRIVAELRRDRHDTVEAEKLLWAMQQSLEAWKTHRDIIRSLLADAKKRAQERGGG
ncbi:MAG TPA: hypothetical protein VF113_05555 [Stellaceae bacterium]